MRRRLTTLFSLLALLACLRAQAGVGECTQAQANVPQPDVDAKDVIARRLFAVPVISYRGGTHAAPMWGLTLALRIDPSGRVVCYVDESMRPKDGVLDPPLRAALGEIAHWRYQPLLKDGKPVAMSDTIVLREQELPQHHLPLPADPPAAWTFTDAHTACEGPCPIYRVVVHGDGRVDYDGIENVAVKGRRSWRIPQADVARLVVALRDGDLWSMRDSYAASITDMPSETLSFQAGTQTHAIVDYAGALAGMPVAVSDFESLIYTVSGAKQRVEGGLVLAR